MANQPISATVAILFCDPRGTYSQLEGLDLWDASRDARRYLGLDPVIAHPPCNRWTSLAALNYSRWGGEHLRPGNDGGCFWAALEAVRRCGGVLEHPASSRAFAAFGIPRPNAGGGWCPCGVDSWVAEVYQGRYGHRAAKRTWLYYVGRPPAALRWGAVEGTHQIGKFDRNRPTLEGRAASATPRKFAKVLIALARGSRV